MPEDKHDPQSVSASNGGIAVGGSVVGSTLAAGKARVQQAGGSSLGELLAALDQLRGELDRGGLDAEITEVVDAELAGARQQLEKSRPNGAAVLGKLKTASEVLKNAAETGSALVPAGVALVEMASRMF